MQFHLAQMFVVRDCGAEQSVRLPRSLLQSKNDKHKVCQCRSRQQQTAGTDMIWT
jgi:hypothetical protein